MDLNAHLEFARINQLLPTLFCGTPRFADTICEFVVEAGPVKALKERDPSGELTYPRE